MKRTALFLALFAPTLLFSQPESRLMKAIQDCDYSAIEEWLSGNDASGNYQGAPWCMWAAYHCGLEGLKLFPHRHNPKGMLFLDKKEESYYGSLLAIAAGQGDTAMLRHLIEDCRIPIDDPEFNPQTGRDDGWQAIHWAASRGQAPAVAFLLGRGADANALYRPDGATPLHYAVGRGNREAALLLLQAGASIGRKDGYGYTPLGIAQMNDDTATARLILDFARRPPTPQNEEADVILQANISTVNHLEFSPDTSYVLINDNLFEVKSGRKITDFEAVMARFSKHPPFLYALEGKEGVPTLWNWRREEIIGKFTNEGTENDFLPRNPYFTGQRVLEAPDGKLLITGYEGIFRGWDVLSGKETRLPLLGREGIADVSTAKGKVLTVDSAGQIAIYDGFRTERPFYNASPGPEDYTLEEAGLLGDGKRFYGLYRPLKAEAPYLLEIRESGQGTLIWSKEASAGITAFTVAPGGQRFAYATPDTVIHLVERNQAKERILEKPHNKPISCLQFSPGGAWLMSGGEDRAAHLFEAETGRLIQSYESLLQQDIGSKIGFIEFTPDGRYIHNGRIGKLFDLHQPGVVNLYTTESALSPDGQYLARKGLKEHANDVMAIHLPDYLKAFDNQAPPKALAYFEGARALTGDGSRPKKITFSPDNRLVAALTDNNNVLAWDRPSGERLFTKACGNQEVDELAFSPDSRRLVIRYYPLGAEVYDTQQFDKLLEATHVEYSHTGKWVGLVENEWLTVKNQKGEEMLRIKMEKGLLFRFAFSHNEKWLATLTAGLGLALWDIANKEHLLDFEDPNAYNRISFSPDDRFLAIRLAKRMEVWETATGKKAAITDDLSYTDADIAFSPDSRFLATTGHKEYAILLWNTEQWRPEFRIFFPGSSVFGNNYIITTAEGYYWGTRFASSTLSFKKGMKVFPFDQFDLAYNRPDIVMEKLGFASPEISAAYRRAYEKRLKKMGVQQPLSGKEAFSLPQVEVFRETIPRITEKDSLSFRFRASGPEFPLERLQIFVNNVPIYGSGGRPLSARAGEVVNDTAGIILSEGENKVEVSVINARGIESLKETFYVTCDASPRPSTLHLITLGVSSYANPAMNLAYPAKDAADIAGLFGNDTATYGKVIIEGHYNQAVTPALLRQLKDKLMQTRVDDAVILYAAGHGVVDENLDYFLATSDTDFSHPSEGSIPYDELEALLDGIPARRKLFLLDACHSGEIDKESMALIREQQTTEGTVQFRSFDTRIVPTRLGLDNSFELMKQLFVDLRRGTGASVISSASGVEFAMEGEQWQNGVFTYCLLKGLRERAADADKDGRVMVSELQRYLAAEVPKLTEGRQQPTFRVENISNDWRVW